MINVHIIKAMEIDLDPEKAVLNPINLRKHDMNANSDPIHEKYKDLDFEGGKPVNEIPALARLQAEQSGKTRIKQTRQARRKRI